MTTRALFRWAAHALLLTGFCLLLPAESRADVLTIDFNAATPGDLLHDDYIENGLRMAVIDGHYDLFDGVAQIDTFAGGHSTVRLDRFGQSFDFLSFMVSLWAPRPDGMVLDETAFLTSSRGGFAQITAAGLLTFSGAPWTDVSWVDVSVIDPNRGAGDTQQDNLEFDNVQYRVPEPASVLLLASGLGALKLARRRSRRV